MERKEISFGGKKIPLPEKFGKRIFMTLIGVLLCSFAVGFFKCSLFGVDPFQCFSQGIHGRFFTKVISYGTYYMILNFIMLIIDLFLDKHYIGLGTFINLFLTGYIVDFSIWCINKVLPAPVLWQRIIMLIIGVVVMCFASALYMTSDMGVSVYDAIPIIISNKTGKPFRFLRIGTDIICVAVGTAAGLMPGLGTIITAFFMGPLVDFFNRKVARPFLNK